MPERKTTRADPVDLHVGNHIRARRKHLGLSQQALGEAIGMSFQQVQKYERGTNRVSPSVLMRIAAFLQEPIVGFFPDQDPGAATAGLGAMDEFAGTTGAQSLARCWLAMAKTQRAALLHVARALADDIAATEPGAAYVAGGDFERAERPRHVS